ncbi:MAG: serine/threonine-protein kinase, partial [Isosphaeraceae bacterium]
MEPGSTTSRKTETFPLPIPGERIDSFELAESIGVGGMGAVFRALDTRLDRFVALKILPPEQASDPEVVQRFYQEGRAAARLDHENIARVYTIGHDGRYHYIAFEYIEGTTLRQRVERSGPIPVGDAINYTLQIADALVHASDRSVVHRDIKPSNIIVTPHGRAKLVDMGLARRFERGGDDGLTQTGMTLGTFDYISPEQARDPRDVDVRSDLYSLGCTLFHMLTGRPPFPGGTVIQKLIQHQEDAPPDVRILNPAVPDDLAAVIVRLMAKDRDRRYQSPEQLVRDLLTTAGALGLRSVSPEGLVWSSPAAPPAWWERHLVWGLPTLLFGLVVLTLFFTGDEGGGSSFLPGAPTAKVRTVPSSPVTKVAPRDGQGVESSTSSTADPLETPAAGELARTTGGVPPVVSPPPATPREIMVDSTENLLEVIASARPRDTLILSDDGPFLLDPVPRAPTGAGSVSKDLVIRADQGVHPVIRLGLRPGAVGVASETLLAFKGGRVTLEGLEFVAESDEFSAPPSIVLAEGTELTIKGCVFRGSRTAGTFEDLPDRIRNAAVVLRPGPVPSPLGDRPPALTIERSHFDGGQVGVLAAGPADVSLRDCTFAACEPAVWFDNTRSTTLVPADLTLRHVSVLVGAGPAFRFDGTTARVWSDDSVFASTPDGEATLVETDLVDALNWRGRGNLFARVGTYLRTSGGRPDGTFLTLNDPIDWSESRETLRESGSLFLDTNVWAEDHPLNLLATDPRNPTRAFQLTEATTDRGRFGVRVGPSGDLVSPPRSVNGPRIAQANPIPQPLNPRDSISNERATGIPKSATPADRPSPRPMDPTPPTVEEELPEMPVMPPPTPRPTSSPVDPIAEQGVPKPGSVEPAPPSTDSEVIRSATAFIDAVTRSNGRGGVIRIAANADWVLPSLELRGKAGLKIEAEPGARRPRLRFRPPPIDPTTSPKWFTLFDLQTGSLQITGLDLSLPGTLAPREGRWSVFSVSPGTELALSNCTLTIEGDERDSAVVIAGAGLNDPEPGASAVDPAPATLRFTDSLIRAGGDVVDVSAGRRVILDVNNAVIATGGSLVHAHGLPRGQVVERLSILLRRVSARTAGGVLLLESASGEPELPQAEIK